MSTATLYASKGTYVSLPAPTTNYDTAGFFRVGVGSASGNVYKALIAFDLSSLRQYTRIRAAILYLYSYSNSCYTAVSDIKVSRNTSDFNESTATWNSGTPTTTATNAVVASWGGYNAWYSYDVTKMVQDIINGASNYGFTVEQNNTTTLRSKCFYSEDDATYPPYLEIEYTDVSYKSAGVHTMQFNSKGGGNKPVHVLVYKGNTITFRDYEADYPIAMAAANTNKCTSSGDNSSTYAAWKAFNKDYSDAYGWASSNSVGSNGWIAIKLDTPMYVTQIRFRNRTRASIVAGPNSTDIYSMSSLPSQGTALASITKTKIGTITGTGSSSAALSSVDFNSLNSYEYLLFNPTSFDTSGGNTYVAIGEIYVEGYLDV